MATGHARGITAALAARVVQTTYAKMSCIAREDAVGPGILFERRAQVRRP